MVESETPEAIAKKRTHELHQVTELTGDQQRAVFKALLDYHLNVNGLNDNSDITAVQTAKASLNDNLNVKLKGILNAEQFKAYLRSLEKPKE